MDFNSLALLVIIYLLSYGAGLLVSKFWGWLRVLIIFLAVGSFVSQMNYRAINLPYFLVFIVPMCIFVYPSLIRTFPSFSGFQNPFSWVFDRIGKIRYHFRRRAYEKREREDLKRRERILKMQNEEAERQRQFAREKAEREDRERAKQWERQQRTNNQNSGQKRKSESAGQDRQKPKAQDPYEVLGVTRSMSRTEIRKVYLELMKKYAPDHVAHLSKEFQQMAHEKCVAFNLAWEKIQKEK